MKESLVTAVGGIIKRKDCILIAERPVGKPYSGYWEFPGGKVEPGETGEEALKRELYEELGIEVMAAKVWLEHLHQYPDKKVALQLWLITHYTGEPRGEEGQRLQWVPPAELIHYRLLEGNWAFIEKMQALMTAG